MNDLSFSVCGYFSILNYSYVMILLLCVFKVWFMNIFFLKILIDLDYERLIYICKILVLGVKL